MRQVHQGLMCEQGKNKKACAYGEKQIANRKWATIGSSPKLGRGLTTANTKTNELNNLREKFNLELDGLYIAKEIIPKFNLNVKISPCRLVLSHARLKLEYLELVIPEFSVLNDDKVLISGKNASGKSSFLRALLNGVDIFGVGIRRVNLNQCGYLDQHYQNLDFELNGVDLIYQCAPSWNTGEIRHHLNNFLLSKNELVATKIRYLSGGERLRLSLAIIAARPKTLLILDEISNNLDLEHKNHVLKVLNQYPGAYILVCHETTFIKQLKFSKHYHIEQGILIERE